MTTSSEDVLLSVGYVRFKKGYGTLYVMNQRLAWMLENSDTVAVSHKYADIKSKCIYSVKYTCTTNSQEVCSYLKQFLKAVVIH